MAQSNDPVYERDLVAIIRTAGSVQKGIEWCERNARLGSSVTPWFQEAAERLRLKKLKGAK